VSQLWPEAALDYGAHRIGIDPNGGLVEAFFASRRRVRRRRSPRLTGTRPASSSAMILSVISW
jgi:hypothetical protein